MKNTSLVVGFCEGGTEEILPAVTAWGLYVGRSQGCSPLYSPAEHFLYTTTAVSGNGWF